MGFRFSSFLLGHVTEHDFIVLIKLLANRRTDITTVSWAELELLGLLKDLIRETKFLLITISYVRDGVVD